MPKTKNQPPALLWWTDSKASLIERVQAAAQAYAHKFGQAPTLCLVNASNAEEKEIRQAERETEMTIASVKRILPNHYWVTRTDK